MTALGMFSEDDHLAILKRTLAAAQKFGRLGSLLTFAAIATKVWFGRQHNFNFGRLLIDLPECIGGK